MRFFLGIIALVDILAGVVLAFSISGFLSTFLIYFMIGKGLWSIISAAITGFYFDWMGIIDLFAGAGIALLGVGISSTFFIIFGVLVILKGLYTFMISLFG